MYIKCIKGIKIADGIIKTDDGLQFVYPDTQYPRDVPAFWQLKLIGDQWNIINWMNLD